MISIEYWWVLWLLPLPLLVRLFVPRSSRVKNSALKIPFFTRIASVFSSSPFKLPSSITQFFVALIIWSLLVTAASNPVWLDEPIAIDQSGRAIMLAVDISGSMRESDMVWRGQRVTRISVVKAIANQFIESRKGDRIGLILFGSNAFLQAPLTFDRTTVRDMLNDATVGLAGTQTAIGDAIGLAIKSLARYQDKEKILVLLTDGSNNAGNVRPLDVAKIAAKDNIRIYTIGLGANQAQGYDVFGQIVYNPSADLDQKTLQKISKMTHGLFFRATSVEDLQKVYDEINKLVPVKSDQAFLQPKTPMYPWILGACLLLLFLTLPFFMLSKRRLV